MGLIEKVIKTKYKQEAPKLMEGYKKDRTGQYWLHLDKMLGLHEAMGKVTKQEVLDHVKAWASK